MNNCEIGDLKISGSGSSTGGTFKNVSISGSGKISGNIECDNFSVSGSGHVGGSFKSKNAAVSGSAKFDGDVQSEGELKISGSSKICGNVKCGELHISGDANLGGSLAAEQVRILGSAKITGDCNAERFDVEGRFDIGGLLNADIIELKLHPWESRAREIGGEKITVTRSLYGWFSKLFGSHGKFILETGTIEGDDISLEDTKAQVVRGANIKIGDGCEIGLVEYTGSFEQTGRAIVKENRKI